MAENKRTIKDFSNQELLELQKKYKSRMRIQTVLIGLLIGVSIYITLKQGMNFFTIFPLFFILMIIPTLQYGNKVNQEMKSRNL